MRLLLASALSAISACALTGGLTWDEAKPAFTALAYEQENARFCGWDNPARAEAMIDALEGELKAEAARHLEAIREEFSSAEAEYVCTPERMEFLKAEADAAMARWEAMKNK